MNGGNTPLVGNAKVDCPEPDGQGQMRAVYNSPGGNRGLMAARAALANLSPPEKIILSTTAFRANEALGKPLAE